MQIKCALELVQEIPQCRGYDAAGSKYVQDQEWVRTTYYVCKNNTEKV